MEIELIVLAIVVLILLCIVAWLEMGIKTLEERCSRLERQNRKINDNIAELNYDVDMLKTSVDDRKKLELMADRKRKMTNYLIVHRTDSKTNLADALYDIANGIKERK